MRKSLLLIGISLLAAVVAAASLQVYANHRVRKIVEGYAVSLGPELDLQVDGTRYDLLRKSAHVQGISLRGPALSRGGIDAIAMDEVVVYSYDTKNKTPHYAHIEAVGMAIPVPITEEALIEAQQIGFAREELTDFKIDVKMQYRFDPEARDLVVPQYDVMVRGLGGIRTKVHLANIDPVFFEQTDPRQTNPFVLITSLGNIQLISTEIFLEFGALADRIFKGLAQRNSMPVGDLKKRWASLVADILEGNPEVIPEIADKITEFIREPGDIMITMSPARPVSVMEIMNMSKNTYLLMEALHVRIEVL